MFEISEGEEQIIETFFSDIMEGLDIRTQERIFNKAEMIHRLIQNEKLRDNSIMTFEILFLTVSMRAKSKNMRWLIGTIHYLNIEKELSKEYYNLLKGSERSVSNTGQSIGGNICICDNIIGKTFFWIANLYDKYQDGVCKPYYYNRQAKKE